MSPSVALLLELSILLIVLSVLGTIARRLSLTPVPLYLLAGLAIGDGGLSLVPSSGAYIEASAQIGLVLLLLMLGLEFSSDEFAESLRRNLPSFPVDAVLNATPGAIDGLLLGHDSVGVLALAAVTWVSSSGIVARPLGDLRRLRNPEAPAVLAVLVLEDFGYQPDRASTHDSLSTTSLRRPHTRTSPRYLLSRAAQPRPLDSRCTHISCDASRVVDGVAA